MTNRFPLIANSSTNQIQELASGDNLDLSSSSIVNVVSIGATNINVTGIVTASSFVGSFTGTITGTASTASFATTSFGLSGSPNITVGVATVTTLKVGTGVTISSGVVTATTFVGALTGTATGLSGSPNITVGVATFSGITTHTASLFGTQAFFTGIVTAQDFDALSDINYKENINTVNGALLKVEQMRGVKFNWKESGSPSYGVIAQELKQVLPELVHGHDPKTVNYNGIIGVLIEAVKELKEEINTLKKRMGE